MLRSTAKDGVVIEVDHITPLSVIGPSVSIWKTCRHFAVTKMHSREG